MKYFGKEERDDNYDIGILPRRSVDRVRYRSTCVRHLLYWDSIGAWIRVGTVPDAGNYHLHDCKSSVEDDYHEKGHKEG